jgi:putative SOS response-associated peptidase YedK
LRLGSALAAASAISWDADARGTKRRCIIYEWHKLDAKHKQPFAMLPLNSPMFAFAGPWERWRDPATQEIVCNCTIITTAPNEMMAPIHNRMPMILEEANWPKWLGEADVVQEELKSMLKPFPAERMRVNRISLRVNSVRNDDEAILTSA